MHYITSNAKAQIAYDEQQMLSKYYNHCKDKKNTFYAKFHVYSQTTQF